MPVDLTEARAALAKADVTLPAEQWWEVECTQGHPLNTFPSESAALRALEEKPHCCEDGCTFRHVATAITLPERPTSTVVDAHHLRAALARVAELEKERDAARGEGRRAGLEEAAKLCDAHTYAADRKIATFDVTTDARLSAATGAQSTTARDLAWRIRNLLTKEPA